MFRIAFSGTRKVTANEEYVVNMARNIIGHYQAKYNDNLIVNVGDADGVDYWIYNLASNMGITVSVFSANWEDFGKAAGPMRNREMLQADTKLLIAFPIAGSKGTWNAINQAVVMKIPVHIYPL